MAVRPLNSIAGFSTGDPAITVIQANADVTTINLTANGISNLGNVGNVHILGGSNGQFLTTDGLGNLNWDNIGNISSNRAAVMPYLIPTGESYIVNENLQGLFAQTITIDGELEVDGMLIQVPISFEAETDQILFATNGNPTGRPGFTIEPISGNITLPAKVEVSGNVLPAADDTYDLGNSTRRWRNGYFGGNTIYLDTATFTVDENGFVVITNELGGKFIVQGTGNTNTTEISNGDSNVIVNADETITISANGNANIFTVNGTGAILSGTLRIGTALPRTLTNNQLSINGNMTANGTLFLGVPPLVNNLLPTTKLAVDGDIEQLSGNTITAGVKTNHLYYANGTPWNFGQDPGGSNTQIQFNDDGNFAGSANFVFDKSTNNLTVTGNLVTNTGAIYGNGSGLTQLTGANVTGTVASATVAGTVTTASQPNITSVGTLSSLNVTGNTISGNVYANAGTIGALSLTGTLTTSAQPNITSVGTLTDLSVNGNGVIGGNLVVNGNLIYVNVEELAIEDPIINLNTGPNGAPPVSNSGKDVGSALNYYDSQARTAFMGWDTSNAEFAFGSQTTISSEVVTFDTLGNVRAQTFKGNVEATTISGSLTTATQSNITTVGTLGSLAVTANINAGNVVGANTISANYLISNTGCVMVGAGAIVVSAGTGGIFNASVDDINLGLAANVTVGSTTGNTTVRGNLVVNNNVNVTGNISATLITGTLTTASQANITTVGSLTNLTVTGNTTSNTVTTSSVISKRSNVAVLTDTVIDSFSATAYRTAKYVIKSENDDGYESLEVLLIHNNINSYITVYAAINDGGGNTVAITTGISSGNVELRATGLAANTVVNLIGTYVPD